MCHFLSWDVTVDSSNKGEGHIGAHVTVNLASIEKNIKYVLLG